MLLEETFNKLSDMRMHGFARALKEQMDGDKHDDLGFDERVGLLVDREWNEREGRSLTRRLQIARLRERMACVEDVDTAILAAWIARRCVGWPLASGSPSTSTS